MTDKLGLKQRLVDYYIGIILKITCFKNVVNAVKKTREKERIIE